MKNEKILSNEELLEIAGGSNFVSSRSFLPIVVVAYGIVATIPAVIDAASKKK